MNNSDEINQQLNKLIEEFKNEVIKENPRDLITFAASYFTNLANQDTYSDEESFSSDLNDSMENDHFDRCVMSDKKSKLKLIQSSNIPRQSIVCESFDPSSIDDENFEKNRKIFPKTPKQLDKLTEILKMIFFFNCLDEEQLYKVIQSMFLIEVVKGEEIIKENDPGQNFYVIDSGTFTATNISKTINERYDGEGFFGELALLYNCPRAATVTANSDGRLWVIDRITFRQLILKSAYQKRQRFLSFIKSVPILEELSEYDQCNLADALKTTVVNNEKIITQGDKGDKMYFIEEGEVMVTAQEENTEKEMDRLKAGEYFGEVALLANIPRIANVYAVGVTKLAELDVHCYNRLMGPCIERMRTNFSKYRKQLEKILSKEDFQEIFKDLLT